jgi:hypothetical protein
MGEYACGHGLFTSPLYVQELQDPLTSKDAHGARTQLDHFSRLARNWPFGVGAGTQNLEALALPSGVGAWPGINGTNLALQV